MNMIKCILLASLLLLPLQAQAYNISITGNETRSPNLAMFPKWTGVVSRYLSQKQSFARLPCGKNTFNPCSLQQWRLFLNDIKNLPLRDKLERVNAYANAHRYIVDPVNWGLKDYWATPYEFSAKDGDCEDYAIAKYLSLKAIGVPIDTMRIMILQDMNLGGIIHAVLVVTADGQSWVLDNQFKQVMKASRIYHYRPIYSINETAWWLHKG